MANLYLTENRIREKRYEQKTQNPDFDYTGSCTY